MEIKTVAIAEQFLILDYAETKFLNFCHEVEEIDPQLNKALKYKKNLMIKLFKNYQAGLYMMDKKLAYNLANCAEEFQEFIAPEINSIQEFLSKTNEAPVVGIVNIRGLCNYSHRLISEWINKCKEENIFYSDLVNLKKTFLEPIVIEATRTSKIVESYYGECVYEESLFEVEIKALADKISNFNLQPYFPET